VRSEARKIDDLAGLAALATAALAAALATVPSLPHDARGAGGLQIREKLSAQIVDTIDTMLKPKGVGVVIKAMHRCMGGIHKPDSSRVPDARMPSR
jgi:GTP cyclohydrolase I-like protein